MSRQAPAVGAEICGPGKRVNPKKALKHAFYRKCSLTTINGRFAQKCGCPVQNTNTRCCVGCGL